MSDPNPTPERSSSRRRLVVAVACVAALIPLVPIVIGLTLKSGSDTATAATRTTTRAAFTPVGRSPKAPAARRSVLPAGSGAVIASIDHATPMHRSPGGPVFATLSPKTGFGSPTFVLVSKAKGDWLAVIATAAGNNHVGWIRASSAAMTRDHWALHAILDRHVLIVSHDGKAIRHFTIATGSPAAPTPPGRFAVTDRLTTGDNSGPYGCCILALSAKAPHAISDWDGGNRIAIHSTPETSSIGHSVSHGCMRLSLADGRWLLAHIPLGTPATISSA